MTEMASQNVWWTGKEAISKDEDYHKWAESEVRWVPRLASKISFEPFSLNIIFGPRQVGKTTLLKLIIKRLLDNGVNPESIFYYRCDELADFRELDNLLREYISFKRSRGLSKSFIFLDEVTYPAQWFRAIKYRIDSGDLKNDVLTLTGSLSMYAKHEVETFPGRRGYGRDYLMLPLCFSEFLKVADSTIRIPDVSNLSEILEKAGELFPFREKINELFELYLASGGYPEPVKMALSKRTISNSIMGTYVSSLRGDLARLRCSEAMAKRIIKAIIERTSSRVSLNSIAKELEVRSHKTVFRYLEILENLFVIKILYFMDPNTGEFNYSKLRKVYLTDPILYSALSNWSSASRPDDSKIAESVVACHLARVYETGYWSNARELDVLIREGVNITGIEIKMKEKPEQVRIVLGRMKNVLTLSRERFEPEHKIIPASIFLAMLNS